MNDFAALFVLFYVAHKIGDYWVHVKHLSLDPTSHPLFAVLRLEMDQAFHIATLAAAAAILVSI